MKSVTVTLSDDVYDRLSARAAERDMSLPTFLTSLAIDNRPAVGHEVFERLKHGELQIREQIVGVSVKDNISRDDLYRRR